MEEFSKTTRPAQPRQAQRDRDEAHDRSSRRRDYAAGADGEQGISAGPIDGEESVLEGQLGPDEISEPDEVLRNKEAKLHLEAQPGHSEREG